MSLAILDPRSTQPARQVVPAGVLDKEALGRLVPGGNSRSWIEGLLQAGYVAEALRMLALILPRKYALAWGCECLRRAAVNPADPVHQIDRAGVALAERWLAQPTEEHRLAAMEFGERGEYGTAGAWIAAAAGWADGSMAPKGLPPAPPPETLAGEAVAAALLTAALADVATSEQWLRGCIAHAMASFGSVQAGAVS